MTDWAGLVLAGGASTRMGADKALLPWRKGTLLDQAVTLLQHFGAHPILVSGNRPDYNAVPDIQPGLGPLGGLYSVLAARTGLDRYWLMIIPVDMPQLGRDTLARLARSAGQNGRGAIFDSGPLPMALSPGAGRFEAVERILRGRGKHAMGVLARELELVRVPAASGDLLENINRPDAYRAHANLYLNPDYS